jgi:hypothetical protein
MMTTLFDSKPSGENFIYMMRHSRSNAVKTRLKISRNDDDDGDDYYGKDDKYYYGKDGKDDKYYYGKDGDSGSDSDDEITEPQRGGSTHGMNIVSMCALATATIGMGLLPR